MDENNHDSAGLSMSAATAAPTLASGAVARRRSHPEVTELAAQALELVPDAVIVLGVDGQAVVANRAARTLLGEGDGLAIEGGGPRAETLQETRALRKAITEVVPGEARTLRISRSRGRAPLSVVVAPTEDADGHVVLTITDPRRPTAPDPEALRRLYSLTPMESKVASRIAAGRSLPEISSEFGITVQTVRGHLKQVFAKTGSHRQPELVHLLLTGPQLVG